MSMMHQLRLQSRTNQTVNVPERTKILMLVMMKAVAAIYHLEDKATTVRVPIVMGKATPTL